MYFSGLKLQSVRHGDNTVLEKCHLLYNVMMRNYSEDGVSDSKGASIQIRCGLGFHSLTFDEDYPTSNAGKLSYCCKKTGNQEYI